MVVFGEIGLILLVVEAGLDVDVEMLHVIGIRGELNLCPLLFL